jgi:hypothetical protein
MVSFLSGIEDGENDATEGLTIQGPGLIEREEIERLTVAQIRLDPLREPARRQIQGRSLDDEPPYVPFLQIVGRDLVSDFHDEPPDKRDNRGGSLPLQQRKDYGVNWRKTKEKPPHGDNREGAFLRDGMEHNGFAIFRSHETGVPPAVFGGPEIDIIARGVLAKDGSDGAVLLRHGGTPILAEIAVIGMTIPPALETTDRPDLRRGPDRGKISEGKEMVHLVRLGKMLVQDFPGMTDIAVMLKINTDHGTIGILPTNHCASRHGKPP